MFGAVANLKNIALATAVALTVGFFTGFYVKDKFVKADQIDAAVEARSQSADNIQQSLEQSVATEKKVAASNHQVSEIRKEVQKRIKHTYYPAKQETENEVTTEEGKCADSWRLDVGTVRMLNSARTGTDFDPTSISNAESEAPSDIGAAEFIDNDLEVVGLYRELATRHDELVDWVNEKIIKKQAE